MLVSLSGVSFGYGAELIFENLDFQVNAKERVGVVGPNGHGKSTLLRLLAGALAVETGERSVRRGTEIGYLKQSQEFPDDVTVHDLLLATFPEILGVRRELDSVHARLEAGDSSAETVRAYGELQHRFEELDGYAFEARVDAFAAEVGFGAEDLRRKAGSLSGGERSRFEIARVLLREPDLLLLDEPTNHLDLLQTERLEQRLAAYPRAFLLVSHDRAFLRATCNVIVEVERRQVVRYSGGYDFYRRQRDERLRRALDEYVRQNERIEKSEDFIRRNIAGQKTKQAQSRRKMLAKLERVDRPEDVWEAAGHLGISFEVGDHAGGKEMMRAREITVGFAGKEPLVRDFDWTLYRGDRVGVVGPNGGGKTTLARVLLEEFKPLSGYVELGYQAKVGYLDQKLSGLSPRRTLVEEVQQVRPELTIDEARAELARYRFFGEGVFKSVAGLSGGERCRLALLKLSLEPCNLLLLDEPTNHLDIPAQEALERALAEFAGTLIVISHDRAFLDATVRRILWIADGVVHVFEGNYSAARKKHGLAGDAEREEAAWASERESPRPVAEVEVKRGAATREESRRRRSELRKARNRLEKLEQEIAELEGRSRELHRELAANPLGDWEKVHRLANEEQSVRSRLERCYAEWERVSARLEAEEGAPDGGSA
jgi:ATP-binding cassette subfamily F protein 3